MPGVAIARIKLLPDKLVVTNELGAVFIVRFNYSQPFVFDVVSKRRMPFPFSHEINVDGGCFAIAANGIR